MAAADFSSLAQKVGVRRRKVKLTAAAANGLTLEQAMAISNHELKLLDKDVATSVRSVRRKEKNRLSAKNSAINVKSLMMNEATRSKNVVANYSHAIERLKQTHILLTAAYDHFPPGILSAQLSNAIDAELMTEIPDVKEHDLEIDAFATAATKHGIRTKKGGYIALPPSTNRVRTALFVAHTLG